MRTHIRRWGHSLAVRIPKPFAEEANLDDRAEVELTVAGGKLVVAPVIKPALTLKQLLARVTKRNLHGEIETGPPVGREIW